MNETDNNVTSYIIRMIPQQSEMCVMVLSILRVYETAAPHSPDIQNTEVHDMLPCRLERARLFYKAISLIYHFIHKVYCTFIYYSNSSVDHFMHSW